MKNLVIGDFEIKDENECFVIAEIGMNHNGSIALAKKIIKAAKDAGCHAVKFQMFTAEKLVTKDAKTYGAKKDHLPKYQQEMFKKYEFSEQQYVELKKYCDGVGILFGASVFDEENADMLNRIGGSFIKIASMDITHLPLINHCAKIGLPIILSTGMSSMHEVEVAVDVITSYHHGFILLHCISSYPAKKEDANLLSMITMKNTFHCPVGFSDHTPRNVTSILSYALGGRIIEKHFTIDKKLPGVDHHLSLDAKEMKELTNGLKQCRIILGNQFKCMQTSESETRLMARRSVVAKKSLKNGQIIKKEDLIIKRPGTGIPPMALESLVGKKARKDIKEDEVLLWENIL